MSCTASALPASSTSTYPRRIEVAEIRRRAGVDDHRSDDKRGAPARALHVADHVGDPLDARFHVALGGDAARHERKAVAVALAELGHDADAVDRSRRPRSPARRSRSLRHTARPFSMTMAASIRCRSTSSHWPRVAHPGAVVAGRIEVVGRAPVGRGRLDGGVDLAGRPAPEGEELFEQVLHRHRARRRVTRICRLRVIVVGPADGELDDLEARAVLHDGVEDLRHQPRIDEVAFGFDDFADGCVAGHWLTGGWRDTKEQGRRPALLSYLLRDIVSNSTRSSA